MSQTPRDRTGPVATTLILALLACGLAFGWWIDRTRLVHRLEREHDLRKDAERALSLQQDASDMEFQLLDVDEPLPE